MQRKYKQTKVPRREKNMEELIDLETRLVDDTIDCESRLTRIDLKDRKDKRIELKVATIALKSIDGANWQITSLKSACNGLRNEIRSWVSESVGVQIKSQSVRNRNVRERKSEKEDLVV
jgi:hypothetical protein